MTADISPFRHQFLLFSRMQMQLIKGLGDLKMDNSLLYFEVGTFFSNFEQCNVQYVQCTFYILT